MNLLSAFSFGKIIKTFVPGLLATGGVLLVVELLYRLSLSTPCPSGSGFLGCFFGGSFLRRVALVDTARTTAFGAFLIPIGLMLGFLLNTFMWWRCNDWCRRRVECRIDANLLAARQSIEARASRAFRTVVGQTDAVPRTHLQDFYLPLLDLDKLTFLRESYFAWFEFHFNSLAAMVWTGLAYVVTVVWLAAHWTMPLNYGSHVLLPVAALILVSALVYVAGLNNLRRYQEGFIWFLIGTLHFRSVGP